MVQEEGRGDHGEFDHYCSGEGYHDPTDQEGDENCILTNQ